MILVDVYVPSVDASYDFMLDENAEVWQVITEICGMIAKKAKESMSDLESDFRLYSFSMGKALDLGRSLAANQVTDGCRLLLV